MGENVKKNIYIPKYQTLMFLEAWNWWVGRNKLESIRKCK